MNSRLQKAIRFSLFAYVLSLLVSIAAMELFSSVTLICTLIFVALNWRKLPPDFKEIDLFDKLLLAFLAVVILGALINTPPPADPLLVIGRARFTLLLILFRRSIAIAGRDNAEHVITPLLVVSVLVCAYGLFQHFTGIDLLHPDQHRIELYGPTQPYAAYRSIGLFSNSMTFGNAMAVFAMLPFSLYLRSKDNNFRTKCFYLASVLLSGLAVFSTMSRSSWVGILPALCVIAFLQGKKTFIRSMISIFILVTSVFILVPSLKGRFVRIFDVHYGSNTERLDMWRANFEIFKDYPILGVGYGENERLVSQYYDRLGIEKGFVGHAHNNFFQFLSGTGTLGTGIFYLFSVLLLINFLKRWRESSRQYTLATTLLLAAIGSQVANHFGGIGECTFKDTEINHQLMLLVSFVLTKSDLPRDTK